MRINYKYLLILFFVNVISLNTFADSPLTSTPFGRAFITEPIVAKAAKSKGKISKEMLGYLADESNPIEIKLALINQLGWSIKGQNNGKRYFNYLTKTRNYKNEGDLLENCNGDEMISLAYLYAMDNYFNVSEAENYAGIAIFKSPGNYSAHIIRALISAQHKLNVGQWCKAYNLTDRVRKDPEILYKDVRQDAIDIIFEYMDIYKKYCKY
jgi:hypothetical protein